MLLHRLKILKNKENEMGFYGIAFLFGALGTLFVLFITHLIQPAPIKIGTVNVTGIVEQFIRQESSKNLSRETLKKEVRQFGLALDKEIKAFSKRNNVVLFLYEAVVANVNDYTEEIKDRMQSHFNSRDVQ